MMLFRVTNPKTVTALVSNFHHAAQFLPIKSLFTDSFSKDSISSVLSLSDMYKNRNKVVNDVVILQILF